MFDTILRQTPETDILINALNSASIWNLSYKKYYFWDVRDLSMIYRSNKKAVEA